MKLVELTPAEAPKDAVPIVPTSLYPNPVKFLYAVESPDAYVAGWEAAMRQENPPEAK